VVWEELTQRENNKEPTLERGAETEEFVKNWLVENDVPLTNQLGIHDGPPFKFLTGVFIATSTLKQQVPFLQEVIQADGAHMSFGKYTLFSAYANSANGAMVSLGFAILFGNEDTSNWIRFWKFIKSIRLIVNQPTKTVITDQDKGSLASIRQILPDVWLFHCAFHCRQNIKKQFGGREGNTPLTCLWMYNILVKCNSVGVIRFLRSKYLGMMKPAHVAYLKSLPANQQFPAARCNKLHDNMPDIYMYGKTASSGVESMNRVNDEARGKNAVGPLNAALVILKKEGNRFPWLRKSPTCRRHVAPTAKCWHFWPKCPCRADTILIPTHFFVSGFADIHQNFLFSTIGTYGEFLCKIWLKYLFDIRSPRTFLLLSTPKFKIFTVTRALPT
jgi:hypothetical protein